MEAEQANEAVEPMQAAPLAGAENEREHEKSSLLERMEDHEPEVEGVLNEEPALEEEPATDSANEAALAEARKTGREALAREFPEALAEGTELYEACREELAYLREARSPLASDPQAEYKIARRMARLLGMTPKRETPSAPAKVPATPPRRSVRPVPTGGAPVETPATTLERRVSGAKSTGEMLDLMREIGTPFEALLKRR